MLLEGREKDRPAVVFQCLGVERNVAAHVSDLEGFTPSADQFEGEVAEYRRNPDKALQELRSLPEVFADYAKRQDNIMDAKEVGFAITADDDKILEQCRRYFILLAVYKDAEAKVSKEK